MSLELQHDASRGDAEFGYRALSSGAVVSVVLGLLSLILIPTAYTSIEAVLMLSPLPLAGIVVGLGSWRKIRRVPYELTGGGLAMAGALLSAALLIGGVALSVYVYTHEVPDGYTRLTFRQMKPEQRQVDREILIPPDVRALDGQQVFLKGYMRPPAQMVQTESFLLVRDNQECCFGEQLPMYFDQVQVRLVPPLREDYSTRLFRVAGRLKINPAAAHPLARTAVFTLQADYVK